MGSGDWNDGMNLVGIGGKGESVWLAWFLCEILRLFAELAESHGDERFARLCDGHAEELRANIEAHAWDGDGIAGPTSTTAPPWVHPPTTNAK